MLLIGGAVAAVLGVVLIAVAAIALSGGGGSDKIVESTSTPRTIIPSPTPKLTVTPAPTPSPVPVPPLGDRPYTMIIPKLGVNAPVEAFGLDANQIPEVPTGGDAANVVAWYSFSAKPGTGSNAVFAGHVTWFGAAVFYNLTSLAKDDQISLKGQDGTELMYKVSDVFDVDATDPNAVQVMGPTSSDTLTIITCDGTFTDTNDPVFGGEYNNRLVVRAALEKTVPGSAVAAVEGEPGG
jgi:LPXTG-site transpeptidase (sortase) family protein